MQQKLKKTQQLLIHYMGEKDMVNSKSGADKLYTDKLKTFLTNVNNFESEADE